MSSVTGPAPPYNGANMYAKTNLQGGTLTPRAKKTMLWVCVLAVVVIGGLSAWGALASDRFAGSANGCVSFNVASSMGGSIIHYCGSDARTFCQSAYTHTDRISLLARPQCAAAGIRKP
jgi:hypothetical protein